MQSASVDCSLAVLAGIAPDLRVGAATVLLRGRNPLHVANAYSLLSKLYPGRIDLGLGRGTPGNNARALGIDVGAPGERHAQSFAERTALLVRYLRGEPNPDATFPEAFCVPPATPTHGPELWLHGSNPRIVTLAQRLGTSLGVSLFHSRNAKLDALRQYAEGFVPNAFQAEPNCCIAVATVCAESQARAEEEAAKAHAISAFIVPTVVGNAATCRDILRGLLADSGCSRVMVADVSLTAKRRLASYQRIADAMQLR